MKIYPSVTEQDINKLAKLSEQEKIQRAIEIRKKNLKQTHYLQLADNLPLLTKNLEKTDQSTGVLAEKQTLRMKYHNRPLKIFNLQDRREKIIILV